MIRPLAIGAAFLGLGIYNFEVTAVVVAIVFFAIEYATP